MLLNVKVKAVVIDAALKVVCDERVTFDADLPEYRTTGGVNVRGRQVTAPTIMWVKALDLLMEKIRITGMCDSINHARDNKLLFILNGTQLRNQIQNSTTNDKTFVGVDFGEVAGVSGCGQQHGSVYWRVGARDMLRKANPG